MAHARIPDAPSRANAAFKWAVAFNAGYVLVEAVAGFATNSLALLADAAHNLTDVAGLLIAWGAAVLAKRPPTGEFSYGFGRSTILAALANAVAILVGAGAVILEAVHRFNDPVSVPAGVVLLVAMVGIGINAGTALLFNRDRHTDLNAEGAFQHMAADAAVSLGVVIAALAIMATGWSWLDPLVAILVSVMVAWTAFGLLKSALKVSLDAAPPYIDLAAVTHWLAAQPGVRAVHDVHIWALSTTSVALTAHLIMPAGHPGDRYLSEIAASLEHQFGVKHATLQIEMGDAEACVLAPDNVI